MQKDALHTYEELGELVETNSSAFGATTRTATDVKGKRKGLNEDDEDNFSNEADTLVFTKEEVATAREFLGLAVR